jgi:hypothetical protein
MQEESTAWLSAHTLSVFGGTKLLTLQVRDTKVLFDNPAFIQSHGCQIKRILLYP